MRFNQLCKSAPSSFPNDDTYYYYFFFVLKCTQCALFKRRSMRFSSIKSKPDDLSLRLCFVFLVGERYAMCSINSIRFIAKTYYVIPQTLKENKI